MRHTGEMVKHCSIKRNLAVCTLLSLFFIPGVSLFAHEGAHSKITRLSHEIEKTPTAAMLYLQRGAEYQQQFLWDKALADFQRVAELEPGHKLIAYYRGSLFYSSGHFEQAEKELNAFLLHAVNDVQGLILRARILRKLNEIDRSYADYTQAISISSQVSAALYIERAELLIEGGDKYFALALSGLNEGISSIGPLMSFEITAIEINLKQENYTAAIKRIDNILSRISRKEKWLERRAEVLEQADRFTEAKLAYMDALKAIEALPKRLSKTPALVLLKQQVEKKLRNYNKNNKTD